MFDLARIEYAGRAFGRRRCLEIPREFGDLLLEILQRTKRGDVEYRHEASVIMPPGGIDAEAQAGEQSTENLDHRSQAAALVTFASAERQQRATVAELSGIGGLPSFAVDDPSPWNFFTTGGGELDFSGGDRRR